MSGAFDGLFLPLLNDNIETVFGPTDSMFIHTTPRQFLFDGVEFCVNPGPIDQTIQGLVCNLVEQAGSKTIVPSEAGNSLKFSMFAHVSLTKLKRYQNNLKTIILEKSNSRWKV